MGSQLCLRDQLPIKILNTKALVVFPGWQYSMCVTTYGCWEKQFFPQLHWEDNWKLMSGLSCPMCFFLLLILLSQTRTMSTTALLGSTKTLSELLNLRVVLGLSELPNSYTSFL